ncbi:Pyrokinin-1 receptor [Araneus ventricosus]|uniref:Pyrokinin-1 receptor n=1 Tax=Araneus ventricosus TaxID=182803 RepID=A0A4Y2HT26_ARAVE|nr:Pyrokinin-1 receptor [Araneus ventricosus]
MNTVQGVQRFVSNMLDIIMEAVDKSIQDEQNNSKTLSNLTVDMFSSSDTNYSDGESYYFEHEDQEHLLLTVISMTIVYSVLFFTGVVGNICTCIVIYRNRYMHTATNYYLFSLAISDLLLLVMSLPQEVYELWVPQPYPLGETMCVIRGFTAETSTYASILTITAFTAERYIAICHPLKSHTWSSLSRALKIIVVVWTIAALFAVPVSFQFGLLYLKTQNGEDVEDTAICALKRRMRHAFLISSLLFFWIPQIVLFFLYVKIGLKLRLPNPLGKILDDKDGFAVQGNSHKGSKDKRRISINSNRKGIIKMLVHKALIPTSYSTYLLWVESGRGLDIGYYDSGLSTPAITAAVIQRSRMLRQAGGNSTCGCGEFPLQK